jgi:hypothetical protein
MPMSKIRFGKKVSSFFNPNTQLKRGTIIAGKAMTGGKSDAVVRNIPGLPEQLEREGISHYAKPRPKYGSYSPFGKEPGSTEHYESAKWHTRGEKIRETLGMQKWKKGRVKRWITSKHPGDAVKDKANNFANSPKMMAARNSSVGKFFGRQGKKAKGEYKKFAEKPGRYAFGKYSKANKVALAATRKMAIANLNAAAEIKVNEKGLFAVLQPIFWGCKVGAWAMSAWQPVLIAGLIFGIFMATWFYGLVSAYYGLYFLKCIPAVFANVFLTIGNTIWFAVNGLFNLMLLGIITLINGIFYYFLEPLYGMINWLTDKVTLGQIGTDMTFKGLSYTFDLQPRDGFCYVRPDPIKATGNGWEIFLSFFAYSFVRPGEDPWLYDSDGEILMDPCYTQNWAKLEYPKLNPVAKADFIWDRIMDKPPPSRTYNFDSSTWGATLSNGILKVFPHRHYAGMLFTPPAVGSTPILDAVGNWWEDNVAKPIGGWVDSWKWWD